MKRLLGVLSVACLALQAPVWAQQNINQEKQVITSPVVKGDKTVTFTLRAPNAKEVLISGDWMQGQRFAPMQRGADGVWTYTTEVLPSDVYIYSYLVDGTRIIDPSTVFQCRDVNSLFSMFYIDGEYGDYYQVQNVPHGNVSRVWYHSDRLKADRRMTIYTPAGYEESKASYPVLYLLHGSGGDEEAWITLGSDSRGESATDDSRHAQRQSEQASRAGRNERQPCLYAGDEQYLRRLQRRELRAELQRDNQLCRDTLPGEGGQSAPGDSGAVDGRVPYVADFGELSNVRLRWIVFTGHLRAGRLQS